ncbi:hypothetical protein [Amnibacterium kyonggiense]|uniref:Uncharacterized protein n=1 Tax=Amnibacterium kyonggiense TaxID=595671 RepID=A0A4V3EB20_9MICO|nr:hypothetical protein [Amnibacterium kyonggiense]TDS80034.1 hypothetical protein CLV52_0587 [Amnibacterium kyonggiense]
MFPPNWSQFVPDLLNAGLTAALVALAVWWLQLRHDRADARRAALDDWNRLRVFLRPHFGEPSLEMVPGGLGIYHPVQNLREALKDQPIEEWARLLPENAAVVALARLEQEWPRLEQTQRRLAGLTPSVVRESTPSGRAWGDSRIELNVGALVPVRIEEARLEDQVSFQVLTEAGLAPLDITSWLDRVVSSEGFRPVAEDLKQRFERTNAAYRTVRASVME